ncbi:MAG TPA: glycosyltransferase [Vicinamibacterales bacterium]|nr:glycosyltransferase [Vicinamibacterales bacterium]
MNVSIVIPAFNAAGTIADALESVTSQSFPHWEAIVVDDGSTDETAVVARRLAARDPRIKVTRQENGGESAARNTGISLARGEWLLFLDADDWIAPRHLERLTAELLSHPELDAVHCGSVRVALDGTEVADGYAPPSGDLFPTLARRAAFPVHACLVRKSRVDEVGRFDTSLRKSADWDLWQRVARTGALFGAVREVLAYYRMQPNSASLDAMELLRDGLRVLTRGHGPDPRVANPHPAYSNGCPPESAPSQQFYLLCWCAGLSIGEGTSAMPLLELVSGAGARDLYPDAVGQCLFESAPLPAARTYEAWESMWPAVRDRVEEFLRALEERSGTPDLASRALIDLKQRILRSSPSWRLVFADAERRAAEEQALRTTLEADLRESQRLLQETQRLLGDAQRQAQEKESALAQLEREPWVRLGRRVRMVK